MNEFQVNEVSYGDPIGLGAYEIGHYRQHLNYINVLAARTPPIVIAIQPIMRIGNTPEEIRDWLNDHETLHELLRPIANIQSINLADLDYTKPQLFYEWLDVHRAEHLLLDAAFGL